MITIRVCLTWKEKQQIRMECLRRNIQSRKEKILQVCVWAKEALKLDKAPSYLTVRRIIRDGEKIQNKCSTNQMHNKRSISLMSVQIENELVEWVWKLWNAGVFVNDELIKQKGRLLLDKVNTTLPCTKQLKLALSNGWISRFKTRNKFKAYRSHGESGDAYAAAAMHELPALRAKLSRYCLNDLFNADETGLYFRQTTNLTIGPGRIPGRKKRKERVTLLFCSNADGTEALPPVVVGTAENPRCFGGKKGTELGFDYRSSKKAWMNRSLFFDWLLRLDNYVATTPGRKIALLIDNASCHGNNSSTLYLQNVELIFLPRNTTSLLQPLDLGIIAIVKRRYRLRLTSRAVKMLDSGICRDLYKSDLRTAVQNVYDIWNQLDASVIHNCWVKSGLISADSIE